MLENGQKLEIDDYKIECISAPGHTPGSMAYLFDEEYLFSGDALRISNNKLDIHPFSMDKEQSQKSVDKLRSVIKNSKLVLTAHYGYYEADALELG